MTLNKTILLTGATGFLGSNLLHRLVNEKYTIVVLKRSFSNTFRIHSLIGKIKMYDIDLVHLEQIFSENRIDTIIHCATLYGRKESDPIMLLESNLILPLELLSIGKKHNVSCFINTDTILDKRVSTYSLSKNQFKDWFKIYAQNLTCINRAH